MSFRAYTGSIHGGWHPVKKIVLQDNYREMIWVHPIKEFSFIEVGLGPGQFSARHGDNESGSTRNAHLMFTVTAHDSLFSCKSMPSNPAAFV